MAELILCTSCGRRHLGEVRLDASGWLRVRWIGDHDTGPDEARKQWHLDQIERIASETFATAASGHHWTVAEDFAARVLSRNDKDEAGS